MKQFLKEFWTASLHEARWLFPVLLAILLLLHFLGARTGHLDLTRALSQLIRPDPCGCLHL